MLTLLARLRPCTHTIPQTGRGKLSRFAPTLLPTPAPTPNPTLSPSTAPTPNPSPFPSPLPVTPAPIPPVHAAQWVQVGNDIDGESPGDGVGASVALSSNGAVVAIGSARGVRVYFNAGGGWEQRGNAVDGCCCPVSVSADGNILAVGARNANGNGLVYVFQWILNTWQPLGSRLEGTDGFGSSFALSDDGTILAVGARRSLDIEGHVKVFSWTGTDWIQPGSDLLGSYPGGWYGNSVSLSSDGSILAYGFYQYRLGYVEVYRWSGSTWQQQGSTLTGFGFNEEFGVSVCLSGDGSIVAVGASAARGLGDYVVAFRNDGTDWVQIGDSLLRHFHSSVSLSSDGKTILIGVDGHGSNGFSSGQALVFRLSPNEQEWRQVGQKLFGEAAHDSFGRSTSISDSGTRIAIGAVGNDGNGGNAGIVRVYDLQ